MEFHAGDIVEVKNWDYEGEYNYNPFVVLGKPSEDYYLIYSETMNENEDGHEGNVYNNVAGNGQEFGHWYISGLCLSLVMPAKKWSKEELSMIYSEGDTVRIVSGCSCGCACLDDFLGEEGVVTKIELYTDGELMHIEVEIPGVDPLEVLDYSSLELVGVKGAKPEDCF